MRKSKLIILPTKCLNNIGFLLLFLSCPVIGDWGRIRPDTDMSQWSIILDSEGSCGLVRGSPRLKDSSDSEGIMEYDGALTNNTKPHDTMKRYGNSENEAFVPSSLNGVPLVQAIEGGATNVRKERVDDQRLSNVRRERMMGIKRRSASATHLGEERNVATTRRAASLERQRAVEYSRDLRRMERAQSRRSLHRTHPGREDTLRRLENRNSNLIAERRAQGRRLPDIRRTPDAGARTEQDGNVRSRRVSMRRMENSAGEGRERRDVRNVLRRMERDDAGRSSRDQRRQHAVREEAAATRRAIADDRRTDNGQRRSGGRSSVRPMRNAEEARATVAGERRNPDQNRNAHNERSASRNPSERRVTSRRVSEERAAERRNSVLRRMSDGERRVERSRRSDSEERQLTRRVPERRDTERTDARRESPEQRRIRASDPVHRRTSAIDEGETRQMRSRSLRSVRSETNARREQDAHRREARRLSRSLVDVDRRQETEATRGNDRNGRQARRERSVDASRVTEGRADRRRDARARAQTRRTDDDAARNARGQVDRFAREEAVRDSGRIASRNTERREKSPALEHRTNRFDLELPKQWRLMDGIKNLRGLKHEQEAWGPVKYGDFATTCLVGAAVYFLTTRQTKSVY